MYDECGFGFSIRGKRIGLVKTILAELLLLILGVTLFLIVATPVKTKGSVISYYTTEHRDEDGTTTSYVVTYSYTFNGNEYWGRVKNPFRSYTEGEEIDVYPSLLAPANSKLYDQSWIAFIILGVCGGTSLLLIFKTLVSYSKYRKMLKEKEEAQNDPEALERKRLEDLRAMADNLELATKQCPYCNKIIGLLDDYCHSCGRDLSQNVEE